jgi:hypothetical protein
MLHAAALNEVIPACNHLKLWAHVGCCVQGIKNVPRRLRVVIQRKRNEDDEDSVRLTALPLQLVLLISRSMWWLLWLAVWLGC